MRAAGGWLRRCPLLWLWLPLVAWMGLIFGLSAQPDLPHPGMGWADVLLSSGAHAFVFGVLAVLWRRALEGRRYAWPIALALTLLYAVSDEVHQMFVPGRCADPWDLVADGVGAVVGLMVWQRWGR